MKFLENTARNLKKAIERHQIAQVRLVFLDMTDRQLKDIGISRDLLKKGLRAYPWHVEDESVDFAQKLNPESADIVAFPHKQQEQQASNDPATQLAA